MSGQTTIENERTTEPILAWRVWKIVPWTTLDGQSEPRLASATMGAAWPTRTPMVAQCRAHEQVHDAPQPDHDCGVWALRSPVRADRIPELYDRFLGEEWAIGRVSLWGRVVEHELGYRAQYAYPFSLTVHAHSEETARALRRAYAVDVEWEPTTTGAQIEAAEPARPPEPRLDPTEVFTEDELLVALFSALAIQRHGCPDWLAAVCNLAGTDDVMYALLWGRGVQRGPDGTYTRVRDGLEVLEAKGCVECGSVKRLGKARFWRFTNAGRSQLGAAGIPKQVRANTWRNSSRQGWELIDTTEAVKHLADEPTLPFVEEIERNRPAWISERRAAEQQGEPAYHLWLDRVRQAGESYRLIFEDEEIVQAVADAGGDREPVPFAAVMERLAPGRPRRSERSQIVQTLVRLKRQGLVKSEIRYGTKLWALP